jgi:oxygen-independent coproporphyrinogen-3 oxidase
MQEMAAELLNSEGFEQYEISAWSRPGQSCRHNLNYWRYGDYLGIGAGAHAKLTLPATGEIRRMSKLRHPAAYMAAQETANWRAEDLNVAADERRFEFFLNQLRLKQGVDLGDFSPRTGLPASMLEPQISYACDRGLMMLEGDRLVATELGWRFINDLQALFLPSAEDGANAVASANNKLSLKVKSVAKSGIDL